jgi:hypothetical protein
MQKCSSLPIQLGLALVIGAVAKGDSITLNAANSGSYSSTGAHLASNQNYLAGKCAATVCVAKSTTADAYTAGTYDDYFVFNLSQLATLGDIQITGAQLMLPNQPANQAKGGVPGFTGGLGGLVFKSFALFDVGTSISNLEASYSGGSAAGQAIYADLGSGTSYGSATPTSQLNENGKNVLSTSFNSAGVDALTAALAADGTMFAVGGAIQKLDAKEANQFLFLTNGRFKGTPQLEITYTIDGPGEVPEPASLGLTGGALLALGLAGRRKKVSDPVSVPSART